MLYSLLRQHTPNVQQRGHYYVTSARAPSRGDVIANLKSSRQSIELHESSQIAKELRL